MKELQDILTAYQAARQNGIACALATVVHVEGSSYRRPGARMLVTQTGQLTGAISGGCLEGDALRKALLAMNEGRNKLVTYDTTDEDDARLGVQLGCQGIVHLLFEPIDHNTDNHQLSLIQKVLEQRKPAVLATLFSLTERNTQPGTCLMYAGNEYIPVRNDRPRQSNLTDQVLQADVQATLDNARSEIRSYKDQGISVLYQYIAPPLSLIIGGAGNDVIPLVTIANLLGWEVTVIDGRPGHANTQRFPLAKKIVVAKPETFLTQVAVDQETICVLMSHNYNYDLGMLRQLLQTPANYIGILGPKTKLDRMYADLAQEGIEVTDKARIFSPVGLDIGAETAEEIALSIAAEIKAVLMNRSAAMLRLKDRPVHI